MKDKEPTYVIEYLTADGFSIKETVKEPPKTYRIYRALRRRANFDTSAEVRPPLSGPFVVDARIYEYTKSARVDNIIVLTYEEKL